MHIVLILIIIGVMILDGFIWIPEEILDWESSLSSCITYTTNDWKRAYDIWERAKMLFDKNESSFDLMDGIINLKRCLNNRIKLIRETY